MEKELFNYLNNKITNSWYKNSKIDYNISGKFLNCKVIDNTLVIMHEEEGNIYLTHIPSFSEYVDKYSKEPFKQLYYTWQEEEWEQVA